MLTFRIILLSLCSVFFSNLFSQQENRKGQIELMVSMPFVNSFYSQHKGESTKISTGCFGISGGVGYQYGAHTFANLIVSGQISATAPVGVDYVSGEVEFQSSYNISLMNNHWIKKWIVGYGISYAKHMWRINYYGEDYISPEYVSRSAYNNSLGLNVCTYFNIFLGFNVGIVYRPSLLTIQPDTKFSYQHSISLDVAWRFRINTKKSKT